MRAYRLNAHVTVEQAERARRLSQVQSPSTVVVLTGISSSTLSELKRRGFRMEGRHIRFVLPMPAKSDERFTPHSRGPRTGEAALKEWEQAIRQRWRALALVIKAKLEAVESGISEFQDEFLANIVLPTGETAGAWMRPQIDEAYRIGTMPQLLPMLPAPEEKS